MKLSKKKPNIMALLSQILIIGSQDNTVSFADTGDYDKNVPYYFIVYTL